MVSQAGSVGAWLSLVSTLLPTLIATAMLVFVAGLRLRRARGPWGLSDAVLALCLLVWLSMAAVVLTGALSGGLSGAPGDASGQPPSLALAIGSTALGGLGATVFVLLRASRGGQMRELFGPRPSLWAWPLALSLVVPFMLVSAAWVAALEAMGAEIPQQQVLEEVLASSGQPVAVVAIGYGVLVAPVVEELLFRSFLLLPLQARIGTRLAILATGFSFGLMHLADPASVVPLSLLGAILAWLRLRTHSLGPPILLHVANNAVAFALAITAVGA